MTNVHDVAKYLLKHLGKSGVWKFQSLLYYCQAWSLVWDGKSLFRNKIEAWANGPVIPALYKVHKGLFELKRWPKGDCRKLSSEQKKTIAEKS